MSVPWYLDRESLNKYQNQYYHNKIKSSTTYFCDCCNTNCYNKTNYNQHLKTKKHKKNEEIYEKEKITDSPYKEEILSMIYSRFSKLNYGEPNQSTCRPTK